ncbi:MAG: hypothetical protein H8D96_11560 [Desulfobacterales bacterium]|uniref:Uncharacterized protein n=1 Tax=Candidatus Desulfatibia vada TaxID=2841696 RepID=A0A8J6TKV5_9BACT|nr:hypothetical protein [Candidatus Desulfatibia vada]
MKLETALMILNKHLDSEMTRMPGIKGIPYDSNDIKIFKPNTEVKIYSTAQRTSAYEAVQYRPSLGTLNIVIRDGQNYFIREYGKKLAEIFDKNVRGYKGYNILVSPESKTIKWQLLKEMAEAFSLEMISEEEVKTFIEIIEQRTHVGFSSSEQSTRVYTTLFVLDVFQKLQIADSNELLIRLWKGDYDPPEALIEITEGWMLVEARRYYQVSIEAILSSFCKYISSFKSSIGDFDEFSNDVIKRFAKFKYAQSKKAQFSDIIVKNKTLKDFINKLIELCDSHAIDEITLAGRINKLKGEKKAFNYEMAHYAIILLLTLYCRFPDLKKLKSNKAIEFWRYRQAGSVKHSFRLIDKLISQWCHLPVSTGIKKIIQELSLKLHLGVSQEKWLQTGNFTFRYIRAEPTGFKLLTSMEPGMTNNKILAYIELITGLGFLKKKGSFYKLSDDGKNFLKKYL